MSDEFLLFLVLCVVYFTECLLWLGEHSVAFVAWIGTRWRETKPSGFLKASKGGILFLNPFPPLGRVICCHLPPFSVSPKGICSLNSQGPADSDITRQDARAVLFEEIKSVRAAERDLVVNDERFLRFKQAQQASKAGDLIHSLLKVTESDREKIIARFWNEQFDFERASARFREATHDVRFLRVLCNGMFFYLFGLAPSLVLFLFSTRMLIPIGMGMLVIAIQISIEYYLVHRRLYPAAKEDRITNLVKMILFPPASIRACDLITENLLATWNPLLVGHLLLSPERYEAFAGRTARNLKYPLTEEYSDERVDSIKSWQDQTLLRTASDYVARVAKLEGEWLPPPNPEDGDVRSYCPRCLSQFTQEQGVCPDCAGVDLLSFGPREPRAVPKG
jgi:hypothetical protein